MMLIDTHCHLDAAEFAHDCAQVIEQARVSGVRAVLIPAVERANFETVQQLARSLKATCNSSNSASSLSSINALHGFYALGIHPLYVLQANESDLIALQKMVENNLNDDHFVAIGEIGLDFFVPELCTPLAREKQAFFFTEQLKIARAHDLPVVLHVRRAQDEVLKFLRRFAVKQGIAHAFNGSHQQAEHFIAQGLKLGFGGAMSYSRALQIRRLASSVPIESIVLETDAPDIAPEWIAHQRNTPAQLPALAQVLAALRACSVAEISAATTRNAGSALPRMQLRL